MFNRIKLALHEKVHGAKITRHKKQTAPGPERACEDGFETSSASGSEAESGVFEGPLSPGIGLAFVVDSIVDVRSSPFYFYICVGEVGEPASKKKKRGMHASPVLHSKSPMISLDKSCFMLSLSGLSRPEVTVRFSRSAIVGPDSFLGECTFPINLKTSIDCIDESVEARVVGGGNAFMTCHWRLVPFTSEMRPNILPDESLVTDADKLAALVASVRKCLSSMSEEDPELASKRLWLLSLLEVIEIEELNHLLLRLPLVDLLKAMPGLLSGPVGERLSCRTLSLAARVRMLKAIPAAFEDSLKVESFVDALFASCPSDQLTELKCQLNLGGDRYHLSHLVFSFIQTNLVREQILLRFKEAKVPQENLVVSEIDQVVHSPFGSVRLWPDGAIPGAEPLFHALSRHTLFVSNKPLSFNSWTHKLVRHLGFGDAPVLSGAKSDLYALKGGVAGLQSRVDSTKFTNWNHYRRLFPEAQFVWFGESLEFAKTLMQSDAAGGQVALAVVMGEDGPSRVGPYMVEDGIVVCGNFVQAAIACLRSGLLRGPESLVRDFEGIIAKMELDAVKKGKRHRHLTRERIPELKMDLERFKMCLVDELVNLDSKTDIVDSIILTPIEARSPSLTNHSGANEIDAATLAAEERCGDTRFILSGF